MTASESDTGVATLAVAPSDASVTFITVRRSAGGSGGGERAAPA